MEIQKAGQGSGYCGWSLSAKGDTLATGVRKVAPCPHLPPPPQKLRPETCSGAVCVPGRTTPLLGCLNPGRLTLRLPFTAARRPPRFSDPAPGRGGQGEAGRPAVRTALGRTYDQTCGPALLDVCTTQKNIPEPSGLSICPSQALGLYSFSIRLPLSVRSLSSLVCGYFLGLSSFSPI